MAELISVSAINDSLTECPICTQQFDENSRIPRRMPCCVQSICQPCLETYSGERQTMSCPMCRRQHHLPDGVKSLPKEPLILKIVNYLKIRKGIRLPCTNCLHTHSAMAQCVNCVIFLCTECLNAHAKDHTTVTFEEMKGRAVESFRHLHQCIDHHQELECYCHTCQKVVCVSCTVVEHNKGKGHKVVSLDEAHREKSDITDEILTKLNETAQKLNLLIKESQEKKKNIQTSTQKAKEDINKSFDDLLKELQQRRTLLLSEVDQKCEEDLKLTDEAEESTVTLLTKVRSSTECMRQMRSKADKMEDLQLMTSSAHSLNTLLEESPQDVQFVRTGVCFVPARINQLTSIIMAAGLVRKVTYTPAQRPTYVPDTHHYNSMTLDPAEFSEVPVLAETTIGDRLITCPLLEWDMKTASRDITVSGSEVTATTPTTVEDTGCRIEAAGRVLTSRPLVIRRGQQVMYSVKINFSLRRFLGEMLMIFQSSVTNSPVDVRRYQTTGLSVNIATCPSHKQQLCLLVGYDNKLVNDVPLSANADGVSCDLHLCFVLDGDNNKVDVVDVDSVRVISSVTDVVFDRPMWIMMYFGRDSGFDVKGELISGNRFSVSEDMKKLLSSCL